MTLHVRPHIMWVSDVIDACPVKLGPTDGEWLRSPEWLKRFSLWHDTGETVDGAAAMLGVFLKGRIVSQRQEAEKNFLRRMLSR